MRDLDDLMDLADVDPEQERLRLEIERHDEQDLREMLVEAVRFGAWARQQFEMHD